ncbi:MAG: pitrilysin family protein [Candidatus Taylorbacteria bacterium]|nr:pitrilysin family protein [Candidatus Taylorbacteria bacterium]
MKIAFDQYKFTSSKVSGVPVHIKKLPWANSWVEIRVLVHVGALNDPEGKEGVAHFFEHLPFNGTEKYPSFEILERISRQIFMNSLNAYTSFAKTVFEGKVLKENLSKGVEVLKEMVAHPLLLPDEIERERGVITQEIWGRLNNPKKEKLFKDINKQLYRENIYGRQVFAFGWSDTVAKVTKEDIVAFHRNHYHTGNIELIFTGDISMAEAKKVAKEFLVGIPKTAQNIKKIKAESFEPPENRHLKISAKEFFGLNEDSVPKQTEIHAFRLTKPMKNPAVWGTANSLIRQFIFETLRGKLGATYSPRIGVERNLGHDAWDLYIGIEPSKADEAKKIIREILDKVAEGAKEVRPRFEETQRMRLENLIAMETTASNIADNATDDLSHFAPIKTVTEAIKEREAVTFKQVCDLVRDELSEDKLFWFIQEP